MRMDYHWIEFDIAKFNSQALPAERRFVLVQIAQQDDKGLPPSIAVDYLRYAAGDETSPFFVVPGVPHKAVTHWCDCLGDDLVAPLWKGKQR